MRIIASESKRIVDALGNGIKVVSDDEIAKQKNSVEALQLQIRLKLVRKSLITIFSSNVLEQESRQIGLKKLSVVM